MTNPWWMRLCILESSSSLLRLDHDEASRSRIIDRFYVMRPSVGPPQPPGTSVFLVAQSTQPPFATLSIQQTYYLHKYVPYTDGFFFIAYTSPNQAQGLRPITVRHYADGITIVDKDHRRPLDASETTFYVLDSLPDLRGSRWNSDNGICYPHDGDGFPTLTACIQAARLKNEPPRYSTVKVFVLLLVMIALIIIVIFW